MGWLYGRASKHRPHQSLTLGTRKSIAAFGLVPSSLRFKKDYAIDPLARKPFLTGCPMGHLTVEWNRKRALWTEDDILNEGAAYADSEHWAQWGVSIKLMYESSPSLFFFLCNSCLDKLLKWQFTKQSWLQGASLLSDMPLLPLRLRSPVWFQAPPFEKVPSILWVRQSILFLHDLTLQALIVTPFW